MWVSIRKWKLEKAYKSRADRIEGKKLENKLKLRENINLKEYR